MKFPFPRPTKYTLVVKKSSAGFGLFAGEDIPKSKFLIEYFGKLLDADEANRVGGKYLFEINDKKTIQGSGRENTARYINHSCKPNCEPRYVGNRVFIFSTKNIKAGDELTYNYGKEYVNAYIKPFGCRCAPCVKKTIVTV